MNETSIPRIFLIALFPCLIILAVAGEWRVAYKSEYEMWRTTHNYYALKQRQAVAKRPIVVDFTKPGWESQFEVGKCLNTEQTDEGVIVSLKPNCDEN